MVEWSVHWATTLAAWVQFPPQAVWYLFSLYPLLDNSKRYPCPNKTYLFSHLELVLNCTFHIRITDSICMHTVGYLCLTSHLALTETVIYTAKVHTIHQLKMPWFSRYWELKMAFTTEIFTGKKWCLSHFDRGVWMP